MNLKEFVKYPKNKRYLVSETGFVYDTVRKQYPSITTSPSGYLTLVLFNKSGVRYSQYHHRVMAETFIPNPDNKEQVNHKNSNRADNSLDNLEWATAKENVQHFYKMFYDYRFKRGSQMALMSKDDVINILMMIHSGMPMSEIVDKTKRPYSTIYGIKHNKIYKDFCNEYKKLNS